MSEGVPTVSETAAASEPPTGPELPTGPRPFSLDELRAAFTRPHRAIDVVLAQRERWVTSLVEDRTRAWFVAVMLTTATVFAVPYGLVLGLDHGWHIGALFLGSMAICFPSLHVFSAFVGIRLHVLQSLTLAALTAAVAAIFSFGFAPVLWFLSLTMTHEHSAGSERALSTLLLGVSLTAALIHLGRCLSGVSRALSGKGLTVVVVLWQFLLVFVTYRMGDFLGLL